MLPLATDAREGSQTMTSPHSSSPEPVDAGAGGPNAAHAEQLEVALRVVVAARPVRRVLEATALDRMLPLEDRLLPEITGPVGSAR